MKDYLRKGGRLVMTDGSFAKTFGRFAATDVAEQPNVTRVPETRTMEALQETFRPMLPPDDLSLSVGDGGGENPLIHRVFVRQGDFAFLYLHNWGGQDHAVSLRLPQTVEGWTLVPMEGALRLTKDSPLRPVVSFPVDASGKGAGGPVVVAGEVGKGRVVVSSDVMLFQPGRIDRADNARLLKNLVDYLAQDGL